ncbi:ribonuclease P protein component [Ruania alba]|uniref:ribonuclease P protein component n=1 Tax=Ruania alba TaxID=648782 RepID=UPI000AB9A4BB|nr:ribonuclease P protein component [Ruania alba]
MLPARHRMRAADEFGAAIRSGARSSSRRVVVHFSSETTRARTARVGFVVSKAVGNAVTRNAVKRRLRALMADRVANLPEGSAVVVRALPSSAESSFAGLRSDLDEALAGARSKFDRRAGARS